MSGSQPNDCPFCALSADRIIDSNAHALAIADAFPVSPGHALIIPRRPVASFFEASIEEQAATNELLRRMRDRLAGSLHPDGFNIGINDGEIAGQTIMHLHIHLIPRFVGDVVDPQGGVRNLLPGKGPYRSTSSRSQDMVNAIVVSDQLAKLAKDHLLARSAFNRAYCRWWESEVKPCSDETGWKLLEAFCSEVEKYHFKLRRSEQSIEKAAWEIFRRELVSEADYGLEDVVGFVKWYGVLKNKISRAIGHLYEFHGDSFADLVDSYPLAGRELAERALATYPQSDRPRREGFLDEREVTDAVLEKLGSEWHKLICLGVNYVANALEVACRKCYLHRILTGVDEQVAWTEHEKAALDFVGHYDG
jgi:diadenosine tetraphosphate (Ap4A) HIT family hydrolase